MKGSLCGVQRDLIKIACSFFHTTIEVILHVPGRIEKKIEREAVGPNRRKSTYDKGVPVEVFFEAELLRRTVDFW